MRAVIQIAAFAFVSLTLLVAGYFGAQGLWRAVHHRYDAPSTGYYHGLVRAKMTVLTDEPPYGYSLSFKGKSVPGWRWRYPTSFRYETLDLNWIGGETKGEATLSLPSMSFQSPGATGVLTRELLAEWLVGKGNRSAAQMGHIETIWGYLKAATDGTLPPPRHHTYYSEQVEPVSYQLTHFCLGYGVSSYTYLWALVWLVGCVFYCRRIWSKTHVSKPEGQEV